MIHNIDASTYNGRIQIGKQGENLTTSVVFDCNAWLSDLDGGTLSIVHQRNSDPDAYPCGDYELDGKVLTWYINETDVAFCGIGACELRYTIGERIAKSKTFVTQTLKGLDPNETPPEAWEPYIDRVIDAATHEIENMTVSASATQGEQTSASVTKTRVNDHEHLAFSFVVEKGDKGDPGQDGQDGKSIVNATASIDANVGTPSVTVTTSSSDEGLSVDLAFHNMKGIPGASFDTSYLPSDTATGNPATFPDGAKAVPVDELTAEIVASQDLHGYSKPWAPGSGKNKLNYDEWKSVTVQRGTAVYQNNGVTLTADSNDCYTYFQPNSFPQNARVPVTEGDVVTLSWEADSNKNGGCYLFCDGGNVNFHGENNSNKKTCQLTIASGITYVTFRMGVQNAGDTIAYSNIMIQVNSSDTTYTYEPYANICPITGYTEANILHNGDADTIHFGQTVYSGSLNVTTGVLTIDRVLYTFNGEESWVIDTTGTRRVFRLNNLPENHPTHNNALGKWKSNIALEETAQENIQNITTENWTVKGQGGVTNNIFVCTPNSKAGMTLTEFENMLSTTNMQLLYPLETNKTVQLTPDEVRTVLGNNSVSSDLGGDVTVIYRADIGKYIDKRLS